MSLDLRTQRSALDAARRRFHADGGRVEPVAADVHASWCRCRSVDAGRAAPIEIDDPDLLWARSPIRRAAANALGSLAELALAEDYVAAVADDRGRIMWSSAGRSMRRRAEAANFVNGANWSEAAAGTNAPGLALVTGRPAIVFASEHWCSSVQDWVCYAAPLRDVSGRVLGVLDLSAHWSRASPVLLTAVTAVARVVELELAAHPEVSASLQLHVLGPAASSFRGEVIHCSNRQLEILTILGLRPEGTGLDELHTMLYGDRSVSETTLKAEISHLRRLLDGAIASRPYRLTTATDVDAAIALDALHHGDTETALRCYRGPLLPRSESPFVIATRHHIDVALRTQLLQRGTPEQLAVFVDRQPHDLAVVERALAITPPDSPLRAELEARHLVV